ALTDALTIGASGLRLPASRKPAVKRRASPSSSSPTTQFASAISTTAATKRTTASPRSTVGGASPNQRGAACCTTGGAGDVSCGGTSARTVSPSCTAVPHNAQNFAPDGSGEPQFEQLAGCSGTFPPFPARLERTRGLRGPPAKRADERPVVVVRELAGPVVELELPQRVEGAVALLEEREAAAVELVGLAQPVGSRARLAQERPRDEEDGGDGEQ